MNGKALVVTGAFGILGRAVVAQARARGAHVAMVDYAAAPVDLTGGDVVLGGVDLANPASAGDAIGRARAELGALHALLNIAGGFTWQKIEDGDASTWDRMYALNLKTALNAAKAALPHLIESQGAIVNVGAAAALKAGAGMGAYTASKAGVHRLTESLAEELKGKVRVNAVLPSILDTPQNRKDMPDADPSLWVRPDDLAKVMLFLASEDARAVTGALVPVMGRV